MFRVLLITAQYTNRGKAHDQYQIPAAGVVQNITANFQIFDTRNPGSQSQHPFTELFDMFFADGLVVSNQNVVLQHQRTLAPAGMTEAAALSFSAAKPAAVL